MGFSCPSGAPLDPRGGAEFCGCDERRGGVVAHPHVLDAADPWLDHDQDRTVGATQGLGTIGAARFFFFMSVQKQMQCASQRAH